MQAPVPLVIVKVPPTFVHTPEALYATARPDEAVGHFVQFWDGRAADVEEQAKGPVMNPVEMAMPKESVAVAVLKSMPEYVAAFKKAFPDQKDPITFDADRKPLANRLTVVMDVSLVARDGGRTLFEERGVAAGWDYALQSDLEQNDRQEDEAVGYVSKLMSEKLVNLMLEGF